MTNFSFTKIDGLIIHKVGNRLFEEGIKFSTEATDISEKEDILLNFYLRDFKTSDQYFKFTHLTDLGLNLINSRLDVLFSKKGNSMIDFSQDFARHLYEVSTHPKIREGELHIAYLKDVICDGETMDAIGIFKSDFKENTYSFVHVNGKCEVRVQREFTKISKGCIIYNTNKSDGYKISIYNEKSGEYYWNNEFLHVAPFENEFLHTERLLKLCSTFVFKHLPSEFEIETKDQVGILNKLQNYVKEDMTFETEAFTNDVFESPEVIEAFKSFKDNYETEHEIIIPDEFDINDNAVKQASKCFKTVLKLDKNFHIYLHGDQKLIERGTDETLNMNYYKLYFNNEQ